VQEQASKPADQGYVAPAVDPDRGKVASTSDMAHELSRGLPAHRAKRDLHAAFEYFASQPYVN
jgi:dienelactone hydrolase